MRFFIIGYSMLFQLFILGTVIVFSPLVPPILVPLSYSMTAALILQGIDPSILSIVSIAAAALTDVIIRYIQNFIIKRMIIQENPMKENTLFGRIVNKINKYFKKEEKIGKFFLKREKYVEKKEGKIITFLFAIFCYLPVIPDIISTRLLHKKITFIPFIIAVIIGKSITHIPFIFLGKSIAQILHLQI